MPFDPSFLDLLSGLGLKVLLLLALWLIWKSWRDAEAGRLEDSQRHARQLMVVARDFTEAIHKSADAQQRTIEMLKEKQRVSSPK